MKIFLMALIIVGFVFVVFIPAIFIIFSIQTKPLVTPGKKLNYDDVERVKQLMWENDPSRLEPGDVQNTTVTERDLNLFLDYALSQSTGNQKAFAHVNLNHNLLTAQFSYRLPTNPLGSYLNVSTQLIPESNRFSVRNIKIGALQIPGWSVNFLVGLAHKLLQHEEQYQHMIDLANLVKELQVSDNSISVSYEWQPDMIKKLKAEGQYFLLPADEKERLRVYSERLAAISQAMNDRTVSLSLFLRPLFQFAQQRTVSGNNPEAEHRALLQNLAAFSVGRNINRFIDPGSTQSYPRPARVKLTLLGRDDLAKHFLVSAAITVSGGSGLANLAGIFKEMDDSRGGSGFSFADLAADRAGVKFAEIAIGSTQQAKLLQQRMSGNFKETDYMPRIDNLPEGIQELEFKRRYRDLDSDTYKLVEAEIERRIAACRIYQF